MFVPRSVARKPHAPRRAAVRPEPTPSPTDGKPVTVEGLREPGSPTHHSAGGIQSSRHDGCATLATGASGSGAERLRVRAEGEEEEGSDAEEEDEPVLTYSKQQRWAGPGEPVCVVCGKYGAYIVDETDRDVCSLECKARHLLSLGKKVGKAGGEGGGGGSEEGGNWVYVEHPSVAGLTATQVEALRSEMSVKTRGDAMPKPVSEFTYLPLSDQIGVNLRSGGYLTPTPVQMQAIPAALTGRDLLVCASTGSGKTLSFLLPLITRMVHMTTPPQRTSPQALILAPTRELCMQIEEQAKQLLAGVPAMKTALLVGGLPLANQLHRLETGVQLIMATPARLNDILDNHAGGIDLSSLKAFVLDEVDCLLQMGFELQVRTIEERLPRCRQNLMFSATIPPRTEKLASELMEQPLFISVGVPGAPCDSVRHTVIWVEEEAKKKMFFNFLRDRQLFKPPAIAFVSSRAATLLLAEAVNKTCRELAAIGFHGDMAQERRSSILQGLLEDKYSVVVATGVLARGLDLLRVKQVFVFDMPSSVREFIHQVGRAGRLGAPGWAVTFVNNENRGVFAEFVEVMEPLGVHLPSQLLHSPHLALQREQRAGRKRGREDEAPHKRKKDRRDLHDRESLMDMIRKMSRKQ